MTNLEGDTPFLCAIRTGSENMLDIYLNLFHIRDFSNQRNANNKYNSLHVAATTSIKNFNIIKKLLRLGIDMVDKNTKTHYFFDDETGTDKSLDFIPKNEENKPDNSILEDLSKQPRKPLNLQIETYLIREFYNLKTNNLGYNHNYKNYLKLYPEYAPYQTNTCDTVTIPLDYESQNSDSETKIDNDELYIDQNIDRYKILPLTYRKEFRKK